MHPAMIVAFFQGSGTAVGMCCTGAVVLLIGAWAAKDDVAQARGLDKIVALRNLFLLRRWRILARCIFLDPDSLKDLVSPYMPGRMFWVGFVGCALIAAGLSIATRIAVRWSGLLVGIMMFMFVGMLCLLSGLRHLHARFTWTIVFRESSFDGADGFLPELPSTDGLDARAF